jgi:L-lactate dehydrogenase complex protein LldG
MSERNAILGRIREALRAPAAKPGSHDAAPPIARQTGAGLDGVPPHRAGDFTSWLPQVGKGFEALAAAFAKASQELRTDFHLLEHEAAAHARLAALRDAEGWQRVAGHRGGLSTTGAECLGLPVLWTDGGYDKLALERCDVGITECDVLVAQTGSLVVTSASSGGRALSVLPPHHVVLARRDQLVPDLPAAFRLLQDRYGTKYPSMISFVTGPSRTGDIERILVLGAHGPKKLTVLLW